MPTKLSRYAQGIMEAAWIAALILTPLFFNKYSSRIFEPDKATLLRTLALVILGAWLVKVAETGFSNANTTRKDQLLQVLKTPIVAFVLATFIVYLLATLLSVTPHISFWGSYQRLQGFYTTSAYLVVFASMAANLRKRAQVDRLILTAILASLPVSLYGVLQKYGIDPIPWGGDVTTRVASHMGNSIFVAAYLIMVFPLTVGRIVDSFRSILKEEQNLARHIARSTVYIFIAALQLIAIYFSQSRGPFLGLLAGSFFLFILLSLHWRQRWLIGVIAIVGIAAGAFLVLLNIQGGPLESIRTAPWVGRFSQVFNMDNRNSQTRILIWQGASQMVAPHDPLEFPDGHTDPWNFIRPLIGYGPETMHMAYNPFYPPELAHVEKRNASPDRSHNETWDSLVITGGLGLAVYLGMFAAVFYYGLKSLGLINSKKQKTLYFALYFGGGLISAIIFYFWQGINFFGVALPFGVILGLIGYLTLSALFAKPNTENDKFSSARSITMIVLLAAIMAHFVEINFGIAIVATRTYFYTYAALLLAVGYLLPQRGEYLREAVSAQDTAALKKHRKNKKFQPENVKEPIWNRPVAVGSLVTSLLLLPLMYEYISNINGGTSATQILWSSLTRVNTDAISYGVLALLLTTWFAGSILFASENGTNKGNSFKNFTTILLASGGIGLVYALWLSGALASLVRNVPQNIDDVMAQAGSFERLLTQFYFFTLMLVFALAAYLPDEWPRPAFKPASFGVILAPIMLILVLVLSYFTNWRVIQADTAFKLAEPFASSGQWAVANLLYQRAKEYAPDEDYYDLFLGRGYLELAKTITDDAQKQAIFENAEADLVKAQQTNPLNPDHTANLARLYSWWALQTQDQTERQTRGQISDNYYSRVLVLSPHNARLWTEWGILYLDVLQQPERGLELLEKSLEIDAEYDWTYALLGNYYLQAARQTDDPDAKAEAFQKAISNYRKALEFSLPKNLNYYYALASIYQTMNDFEGVVSVLQESLPFATTNNDIWKIEENLAVFTFQLGRKVEALQHAQNAYQAAPDTEKERLAQLIQQIETAP